MLKKYRKIHLFKTLIPLAAFTIGPIVAVAIVFNYQKNKTIKRKKFKSTQDDSQTSKAIQNANEIGVIKAGLK